MASHVQRARGTGGAGPPPCTASAVLNMILSRLRMLHVPCATGIGDWGRRASELFMYLLGVYATVVFVTYVLSLVSVITLSKDADLWMELVTVR